MSGGRLEWAAAGGRVSAKSPRAAGFWLVACLLALFMFAASAPSPLYGRYAAAWHFSPATLTVVFAVYALTLLATLLVAGRLSDYVGRRPVILCSLVIEAAAMASFIGAHSVSFLYAARALQGVGTGLATGALSAGLIDLQPEGSTMLAPIVNSSAPTFGLAVGALLTSILVQYCPSPLRLVYWALLGAFAVGAVSALFLLESGSRRPGAWASLRPRASLPAETRRVFAVVLPCLAALWALGGFYLALGPSLAAELVGSKNLLWGGLVIFLLTGMGSVASVLLRAWPPMRALAIGCLMLLGGLGLTLAAIASASVASLLVGTAIAGCGFGLSFLGSFRTLTARASADQRAGLITTIYVASYLAFSLPVVIAGVAATEFGLHDAAVAYAGVLAGLVLLALLGVAVGRKAGGALPATLSLHVDLPPSPCTVPHCLHPNVPVDAAALELAAAEST